MRVALDATLSSQVNKGYFVTDGRIHNIKHFTGAIADAFGVKPLGFTIPFGVMDALCSVTKVYDKITGNKSLINPEQVAKMKARNWDCDIAPLVRDFNFSPRYSLQEAVEETAQWYLENKFLSCLLCLHRLTKWRPSPTVILPVSLHTPSIVWQAP